MIEVVFGDSACGSLKQAQRYGMGTYQSGCIGVIVQHADGSPGTAAEIEAASHAEEDRARRAWEQAIPIGGDPADVFGLSLALSVGDISEDWPGVLRQKEIDRLYSVYPEEMREAMAESLFRQAQENLQSILRRFSAGESVRVWCSAAPDEACGLCFLMAHLTRCGAQGKVFLVTLPAWEEREDGFQSYGSWGDVGPEGWGRLQALQQEVHPVLCRAMAARWRELQQENAPLRAVVNGRLVSVAETLYDMPILLEIALAEETFSQAGLIGNVLGRHRPGVGDAWIALRMEHMLEEGLLTAITEAPADGPAYRRMLRKTGC